ncbi:MAG: TonB-dependent receptor plug domain-containing protein [Salibacteraceae bacterium]
MCTIINPDALMKRLAAVTVLLTTAIVAQAQVMSGVVLEESENGKFNPLPFANVYWLRTNVGASTDTNGVFEIPLHPKADTLIISYVGYKPDTIKVTQPDKLTIVLKKKNVLREVEVVYRTKGTEISYMNPIKVETIGEKELYKAACCNLSESFETNPSVDVATTDAVSGTRQIQMLGLDGKYTQITRESIPNVRGLSSRQGLTFIPGTWIESIQLNKGAGSVVNGFESITGQINTELVKPESGEPYFFNGYVNQGGRTEFNAHFSKRINPALSHATLLHTNFRPIEVDGNGDGFLDFPTGIQLNLVERLKVNLPSKGWEAQVGGQVVGEQRTGGQSANAAENPLHGPYRASWSTGRGEVWSKVGYVFPEARYRSIGIQASALAQKGDHRYGLHQWTSLQRSGYLNAIYQSIIGTTSHKFRTGLSYMYDDYDETLDSMRFARTEMVPGAFFEYSYNYFDKLGIVAGLRADYHNYYGPFFTPRLHVRYEIAEGTVLRLSGGRGQRTSNVIAENVSYLITSRRWIIHGDSSIPGFGLRPEVGWNAGANITREFKIDYRPAVFTVDFYHTEFSQQTVVDLDRSAREVHFYNLSGRSYSTSTQVQFDYELYHRLDLRMAYRWYEVRTTLAGSLRDRPFVAKHRALVNLAYETQSDWFFDLTAHWQGSMRIPSTAENPEPYQRSTRSPDIVLLNAQVTKSLGKQFDLYVGAENITDVRQKEPIIAAGDPFGPYFDSSMIWGPIFGRMFYMGFRLKPPAND